MNETRTEAAGTGSDWPMPLAVAFVLVTLVSLVMVPRLVQERVDGLRRHIEASEPARTLVMQWQFDLVREMAALSELLLTGDTTRILAYASAQIEEEQIYRELAPLAAEMGPQVVERVAAARALANQWHASVTEEDLRRQREAGVLLMDIPRERQLFDDVLLAVAAVDSAIVQETASTRAEIVTAEVTGLRITTGLGILAALAGVAVLRLHARVSRSAAEAERRRIQADEALAETARTTEARNRLIRGITHDVKNPLGAAKGYAELLAMGVKAPLAPEQEPLVNGVERSIDSALAIIADLLDLARADSAGVRVNRVEVDLKDVVREAVADHSHSAETAGHALAAELPRAPLRAYTDPVRVRQVLDNLMSNAIKYTPAPGSIVVRADEPDPGAPPADGAWTTVTVNDTGPGIPAEHRDTIFEDFTRLDETHAEGHGLGLAIARGLSRQLGGDLTVADSERGAKFVLWLPQRQP